MYYIYPTHASPLWDMMTKMIEENYITSENFNNVLLIASQNMNFDLIREQNPNKKIIVYQTEPLVFDHPNSLNWWNPTTIIETIKKADEVWDYDLENIKVLESFGINAKFKPFVFTSALKDIPENNSEDIDILFYGHLSEHRSNFITNFTQGYKWTYEEFPIYSKLKTVILINDYDKLLREYISRSKIIVNLKPFDSKPRQQQARIFYPLINEKCVMSEWAPNNYFGENIIQFTDTQDFGKKAIELIRTGNWKNYPVRSKDWSSFLTRQFIDQ
jgi:hypothetical protein